MELTIVRADPAGNITIFVLNPPAGADERIQAAQALMADPALGAEQIGFVLPPAHSGGLWRLEMTGGEFCGNASRSFALMLAIQNGIRGHHTMMIEAGGMADPVPVYIDTEAHTAEIAIPGPLEETVITQEGRHFPLYVFQGISHIIAENIRPDEALVRRLIHTAGKGRLCDALGVMFFDSRKQYMRPAVWVRATDTLVFESSCGSGSAALGVWTVRTLRDAETVVAIIQPGGAITARVQKQDGKITRLSIAGKVTLSEPVRFRFQTW